MGKKPWSARFKTGPDELMAALSESVSFDHRLAEVDVLGGIAHARMLGKQGIISQEESGRLIGALKEILSEARDGDLDLRPELEDVHTNVEARLREKVGDLAGKLHTGRSRNDQVALDMRLFFRDEIESCRSLLSGLARTVVKKAEENKDAIMPGFTHTRKSQPVLFAHHLLAYAEMFLRDRYRLSDCLDRMNHCPLGAGALAGSGFALDREMVAEELGFDGVTQNSIDAVSDRDFLVEFAAAASIVMIHLSRLMEELVWWGLPELGFVELPERFCTGSSMMPNKKNPDAAELVRAKTGRVTGSLVSLLTVMKGLPLSYNRDMQEDKEGMFDLARTLAQCLLIAERLVDGMEVNASKMMEATRTGFILATDMADYLVTKGMPFREAHEVCAEMVAHCEDSGKELFDLDLSGLKQFSELFDDGALEWLSIEGSIKRRDLTGGTAPGQVEKQIKRLKDVLGEE